MASIFTFESEPIRVASPWTKDSTRSTGAGPDYGQPDQADESLSRRTERLTTQEDGRRTDALHRLEAEPQEGPVEYKLHLLLRPSRKFTYTSTSRRASLPVHVEHGSGTNNGDIAESNNDASLAVDTAVTSSSATQQTRQHRLEQLTTQLLWRLQQSSPYHTSSATNIILPLLPKALPELEPPKEPAKLLHGLEESQGAFYEIGVSDDGTLVGLVEDEMQESLNNLRAMAACLGCVVEVVRREIVGHAEWLETITSNRKERKIRRTDSLVVVEALITPYLESRSHPVRSIEASNGTDATSSAVDGSSLVVSATEQVRVTLVGPTTSGKSTLLGTLTTSTLDNGRGKSRLSMLKHRHEISSGVTSSVSQELIGYQDLKDGNVEVINYATENVASWIDMHVAAGGSRLVLISDSAGHPRYRRTAVRGLVGWKPHWTILCIPADDTADVTAQTTATDVQQYKPGPPVVDIDLSGAHLNLCLRLGLPLIVVITKLDQASKSGLKDSLTKVLDALKAAGRKPAMLPNTSGVVSELDLQIVQSSSVDKVYDIGLPLLNNVTQTVPIVLTSAVQGNGISNLHALLHQLPISETDTSATTQAGFVFHIEDVYNKAAEIDGIIVSGRLRRGRIAVGDNGAVGPFSLHEYEDSEDSDERFSGRSMHLPTSRSFPGALRHKNLASQHFQLQDPEWRRFRVASVRNLRLPVLALSADQVGTIAIVPDDVQRHATSTMPFAGIRKGMVLTSMQTVASRSFVAEFERDDLESLAVGNHVMVYIASVRASAKVVSARAPDSCTTRDSSKAESFHEHLESDLHSMQGQADHDAAYQPTFAGNTTATKLLVTFSFDASKEFIVVGDQVLVMPGGGAGLYGGQERGERGVAGLEGFVGEIVDTNG